MLYKACTSMDNIMGIDIVNNNFCTGCTPILFSCCTTSFVSDILILHKLANTQRTY